VFEDIRRTHTSDGGYFVEINCSTGGTATLDNRLANGRFAVGVSGANQTGLAAGSAEFKVNQGNACPAPVAEIGSSEMAGIEADAGIPPKPDANTEAAYIDALMAIDPDIVHGKPDAAVNRGRNQCSSVHQSPNDRAKLVQLATKRFSSPDHPDGFGSAVAAQILDVARKYPCPSF
jgi:hypothetical protein